MKTVTQTLIVVALFFAATFAAMQVRDSIADAQPAPSLDAGPVTSDIATAPVKPPESVPPAPTVADPTTDPGGFVDEARSRWRSGSIVGVVVLALWGCLLALRGRFTALQKGRTAVYVAGAIAALGVIVEAGAAGKTPTIDTLIAGLAAGLALWFAPVPKEKQA